MRPSHGFISVAGVNPLAPTFDTVGILASSAEVLARAASVLLACEDIPDEDAGTIHLLEEAFSIADPEVRQALEDPVQRLRSLFGGACAIPQCGRSIASQKPQKVRASKRGTTPTACCNGRRSKAVSAPG